MMQTEDELYLCYSRKNVRTRYLSDKDRLAMFLGNKNLLLCCVVMETYVNCGMTVWFCRKPLSFILRRYFIICEKRNLRSTISRNLMGTQIYNLRKFYYKRYLSCKKESLENKVSILNEIVLSEKWILRYTTSK